MDDRSVPRLSTPPVPTFSDTLPCREPVDPNVYPMVNGYRMIRRLGEGGMGEVWEAEQLSTHRPVAIKLLRGYLGDANRGRACFAREIELAARLVHPNIARVYDSGTDGGISYYVMELVEGQPLMDYLRNRVTTREQVLQLFEGICQAIEYAHANNVVHRDIKPSNIQVTPDGRPVVLDFGLAKARESSLADVHVSLEGEMLGTPSYMAPEQAAGRLEEMDARTDVYGLGVLLYELLTGELPFRGATHLIIHQVLNTDPPPPRSLDDSIPRSLEAVVLKAMAKEPRHRYENARALLEDIRRFRAAQPVKARPVGWAARAWLWCQRREHITEPAPFAILFGVIFTLWNIFGMIACASGIEPVHNRRVMISLLMAQCLVLFVPILLIGWATRRARPSALWGGVLAFGSLFLTLVMHIAGVRPALFATAEELRFSTPIFMLFAVISGTGTLVYVVALIAYYANRNVLRWSRGQQTSVEPYLWRRLRLASRTLFAKRSVRA